MHRLMRKLRREMSHGHHLSEEEAMRQVLLQHAQARQEEQWRLQALAQAEEARRQAFAASSAAEAAAMMIPQSPFFVPFPMRPPAAVAMPPWFESGTHRDVEEMTADPTLPTVIDEEDEELRQLQRAMEESKREEEERKRRQAAAEEEERRRHAAIEHEARRQQLLQQQYQNATADDNDEEEDETRLEALEEAKQVQLALQLSLAEQQRARQRADLHDNDDPDEIHECAGDDDTELADALRLSKLVHKLPEERLREEEAIYRSALINEQNREYEESRQRDLAKEEEKRRRQMERDRAFELISLARSKEGGLVPEPPAGAEATELVVRLPDGRRSRRRFPQEAALQSVKDWIDVELAKAHETELTTEGDAETTNEANDDDEESFQQAVIKTHAGTFLVNGYDLVADFPRRAFTDMQASASQAGLCPRALLNLARK